MTSLKSPGRPRDAAIDEAILLAAWDQLNTVGYSALTMTAVAEGAGIQKPALYRRWASKQLLVIDALARHLPPLSYEDRGSLRADLEHVITQVADAWRTPAGRRSFHLLLSDVHTDEVAQVALWERVMAPRNAAVHDLLSRAVERGEVRAGVRLDAVPALLEGPLMHRAMMGGERDLDQDLLDRVLDSCLTLLQGH